MASYTTNLNLKKPAGSENVAIGDINNNMDTIDNAYGTLSSSVNGKANFGDYSSTTYNNLSDVPNGMGYVTLGEDASPSGAQAAFPFIKPISGVIIVWGRSSGNIWSNTYSGGSWIGWKKITVTNV